MRTTLALVIGAAFLIHGSALAQERALSALKIVVISGEDAVNIIQQKTAVAPVIEVRDRNNLPIAGVAVTFSVSGQGAAFAGGAQSLTVVTNAAGQAAAAGLTPTAAGAINISATATFQGQTAIATIAQSNVLTAAEAVGTTAGATGTGSTTSGSTGAVGGGGGLSGTTLGIIGAVAGTGAIVGAKAAGGGSDAPAATSSSSTTGTAPPVTAAAPAPAPTPGPASASFSGPMDGNFSGTSSVTIVGEPGATCNFGMRQTGTATIRLQTTPSGTISGTMDLTGRNTVAVSGCTGDVVLGLPVDEPFAYTANVEGSAGTVRFTQEFRDSGTVPGASYTVTASTTFTGTVSASGVTGTLTYNSVADIRGDGFTTRATWTGSVPINLR